jgi:hypothetical protein
MQGSRQLAILRFAVTLDDADRLSVLAIAKQIDGLGRQHENKPEFRFFRKTSSELCGAILQRDEPADVMLRQYLARINDFPLKRALAAALEIEPNLGHETFQARDRPVAGTVFTRQYLALSRASGRKRLPVAYGQPLASPFPASRSVFC